MRKKNLKTYAVAAALSAAAFVGVPASTAYAEEAEAGVETIEAVTTEAAEETTEAVTTEEAAAEETTEAVTTEAVAEETIEAVTTEAVTEEAITADTLDTVEATEYFDGGSQNYNININGGSWDGTYYKLSDGRTVKNAFFCDGTYTYYLQNDGTPMKDRLTYHPDGEADHVIYFDSEGHEVFNNFANVKASIAGEAVDDLCFFGSYGYMYVNKLTYDQAGANLYYVNPYGVIERNGWFQFAEEIENVDGNTAYKGTTGGSWGCANADGTLMTSQWVYNWTGTLVYLQGDGSVATGMQDFGGTYYLLDENDGHVISTYSQKPETYTTTTYYKDGSYNISVYSGTIIKTYSDGSSYDVLLSSDTYDAAGNLITHTVMTYDGYGNQTSYQSNSGDGSNGASASVYLYHENGAVSYKKTEGNFTDIVSVENEDGTYSNENHTGSYTGEYFYNESGMITADKETHNVQYGPSQSVTWTCETSYNAAGNPATLTENSTNTLLRDGELWIDGTKHELASVTYAYSGTTVYQYDDAGIIEYSRADGTSTQTEKATDGASNSIITTDVDENYYENGICTGRRETSYYATGGNCVIEYAFYGDGETVKTMTYKNYDSDGKMVYSDNNTYGRDGKQTKEMWTIYNDNGTPSQATVSTFYGDGEMPKDVVMTYYDSNGKLLKTNKITCDSDGNEISSEWIYES